MENTKKLLRRFSFQLMPDTIAASSLLCMCILLVLYREAARNGVLTGIHTCLNTLIPSLFPFVLLSAMISRSKAASLLFRPFSPVMRHVFRLPAAAAPALLLGLTAGYPVGAKMASTLYADGKLDREQTARLLCFCTAPGYAFCTYTAAQLSGSGHSAVILFCSTAFPPLLIGAILARFAPKPENETPVSSASFDFPDTVHDGVSAMVSMCGAVVAIRVFLSVLQASGVFRAAASAVSSLGPTIPEAVTLLMYFFEVTSGVSHNAHWHFSLILTALGLGFAGVCIHLQIFSFFRTKSFPIPKPCYLLLRFVHAFCSGILCSILLRLFPSVSAVSAGGTPLSAVPAGNPALSAALLGLSVFFLLVCSKRNDTPKKV